MDCCVICFDMDKSTIISIFSILLSTISVSFVVVDRIRTWRESNKVKLLKKEKAILNRLINLSVKDYFDVVIEKSPNSTVRNVQPKYNELKEEILSIKTSELSNPEIIQHIEKLKNSNLDDLILPAGKGKNFTVKFGEHLENTISKCRIYLADVL